MEENSPAIKDAQLFQHMQGSLLYHEQMLRDEVRNKYFFDALQRSITEQTSVLDIGAGSGVWAMVAAKLGARNVTAVEVDGSMVPIIAAHLAENGLADRVKLVRGLSTEVELGEKFDLVVSETIGNQAFDENIIPTMVDARERFLSTSGTIIPQKVALKAAPCFVPGQTEIPSGVPLSMKYLRGLVTNISPKVHDKVGLELLADPRKVIEVDLRECSRDTVLAGQVAWELSSLRRANAVAIWSESQLVEGLILDAWDTSSWMPVVCKFASFDVESGIINFDLNMSSNQYHWKVSSPGFADQSYAPVFAYTRLKFDAERFGVTAESDR